MLAAAASPILNSMRFAPTLLLLLFSFTLSRAQSPAPAEPARERYLTWSINAGTLGFSPVTNERISGNDHFIRTVNTGLASVQDVSGKESVSVLANTSIGLAGGFTWRDKRKDHYTSIGIEFQNNKACYTFAPPFQFTNKGDTFGAWVMSDKHLKYSLAIERCWDAGNLPWPNSDYVYLRESFGQTIVHRNFNARIRQGSFEDWTEGGTGMKATTVAASPSSWMLSSEIGVKNYVGDNGLLSFGLVYHAPFSSTFTDEYEFFRQGVSTGKSRITFHGSIVMFNLRYTFQHKLKEKPPKEKPPKEDPEPPDEPPVVAKDDTLLGDRKLDVQLRMKTGKDKVTIKLWDNGEIDGDIVSVFLNGQPVLSRYELGKGRKKVTLDLKPGKNYIVMQAENLGTIPPNTSSIEVSDGDKTQTLTITSDEGKSGTIEIDYNE